MRSTDLMVGENIPHPILGYNGQVESYGVVPL